MPMLPNQHPGPRCSCRECLNRYPEGPWNECALSWCQDRMRCAHPLDGRCEAPEAGKDAEQRDSERVAESLALAPEASEAGKEPSEADVLYVGFDKNMEHRMFRMRATAERHCIGEIKEYVPRGYVQRGCLSVLIPDAAVAVGAKSLHLSYFDKDTRQAALAMLTKAMSWPRDIQQREEG